MKKGVILAISLMAGSAFAEPSCPEVIDHIIKLNSNPRVNVMEEVQRIFEGGEYKKNCKTSTTLPRIWCFRCVDAPTGQQGKFRIMEVHEKVVGHGVDARLSPKCFCD